MSDKKRIDSVIDELIVLLQSSSEALGEEYNLKFSTIV
jgi:hypothetical protein